MTMPDNYHFWKTYGKIENILSKYFEKIDGLEVFCYVVDSHSLNSPLAIRLWDDLTSTRKLTREIPATIWLTQEPKVTAEEFILEYTFL